MATTIYKIELVEGSSPMVFTNSFEFNIKFGQTEADFNRPENELAPGKTIIITGKKLYILIKKEES